MKDSSYLFVSFDGARFKSFNGQFEELHQRQSQWSVPDPELRESLRLSIAEVLLPAYRSFIKRFGLLVISHNSKFPLLSGFYLIPFLLNRQAPVRHRQEPSKVLQIRPGGCREAARRVLRRKGLGGSQALTDPISFFFCLSIIYETQI